MSTRCEGDQLFDRRAPLIADQRNGDDDDENRSCRQQPPRHRTPPRDALLFAFESRRFGDDRATVEAAPEVCRDRRDFPGRKLSINEGSHDLNVRMARRCVVHGEVSESAANVSSAPMDGRRICFPRSNSRSSSSRPIRSRTSRETMPERSSSALISRMRRSSRR